MQIALSWLEATDTVLQELNSVIHRARIWHWREPMVRKEVRPSRWQMR